MHFLSEDGGKSCSLHAYRENMHCAILCEVETTQNFNIIARTFDESKCRTGLGDIFFIVVIVVLYESKTNKFMRQLIARQTI